MINSIDWTLVVSVLGVVIQAAMIYTILLANRNIVISRSKNMQDAIIWMTEYHGKLKAKERELFSEEFHEVSDLEIFERKNDLSVGYQQICFLISKGCFEKDVAFEMFGPAIVRAWRRLEPVVNEIRKRNDEGESLSKGAFSRKDFEIIALEFEKKLEKSKYIIRVRPKLKEANTIIEDEASKLTTEIDTQSAAKSEGN